MEISNLSVYASGIHRVELSVGKRMSQTRRVPVRASVDATTGEVRFYVDPEGIERLRSDIKDE